MRTQFLSRFTPSLMPAEALEAIFVQRERLAQRTVELIRDSVLTPAKSHTLFVGPRGIGKTHLVSLIYHRLRAMDDLQDRLRVAWLREEEWGVSSFLDLLLRILRALAEDDPTLASRVAAVQQDATAAVAERRARALLREIAGERTLLLLAENLDDLFEGLGDEGQKRLRAFLQETRFSTLLATSQGLFGGVSRQTSPFYNFFRVQHLSGLTLDEAVEMLTKIARLEEDNELAAFLPTPAGRARVRAVDHLSGGNPRVYVIFSEFLTQEALDELVTPFLKMLDELTPYYQAKMRYLSPQQRKIVEVLTDARGAVSVKVIAQNCYISPQTASSQLKELREKGYVRAHAVGRESFYELQEPLMRLCLEVKKQRGEPIRLFVEFLRLWCTPQELERRLTSLPPHAAVNHAHLSEALRLSATGDSPLVAACLRDYEKFSRQKDHARALQVREELIAIRGDASDWASTGWHLDQLKRYEEALTASERALVLAPEDAQALYSKAFALEALGRREEALASLGRVLAACDKILAFDGSNALTWYRKGVALGELGRHEEALAAHEQALHLYPDNAWAWHNKGVSLESLGRYAEALGAYDKALELDPSNVGAWHNKGAALGQLGRHEEALASFDRAVDLDASDSHAWHNKGYALGQLGRYEEALDACNRAVDLAPAISCSWLSKAFILREMGRREESVTAYDQVLELDPSASWIWQDRGLVLVQLNRIEEALASFDRALGLDPDDAGSWSNKGVALSQLGRHEEALDAYDKALGLDPDDADAWQNRGVALYCLGRHEDALGSYEHALRLDNGNTMYRLNRTLALLALGRWDEAMTGLGELLLGAEEEPSRFAPATELAVGTLLAQDPSHWPERAAALKALFQKHGQSLVLGQALTATIPVMRDALDTPEARTLWLAAWSPEEASAELQLPLRLLSAAVRYLNSGDPPDRRILLELPVEERSIVETELAQDAVVS